MDSVIFDPAFIISPLATDPVKTNDSPTSSKATIFPEKRHTLVDQTITEELKTMALKFASHIPDEKFSPAEIQGFLLNRRDDAKKALDEVAGWVEALLKTKKKGKKVVGAH
ncbi:hypothetical protein GLAREA_08565 [Glarea lozoyensis ATCC 20868]|uniref:Mitochondrial chaperone BCS1-like ATPase lid domain-containing protein n=1 Tax=Glarea lozoyensis (strain ATCC 20868 / MF5171) TaxID=1116229 RepID=S3CDW8_GLAL2|nr:uncharacterized protein GLAREA_08565 [Glarea lozoyensis ATCC 20868]EPE24712.1 hypothetical protein GLAREA_08565 [Glarea lozoyensis ATCC 20868]